MGLSGWHLIIVALVAVLIFGGSGRISTLMGDMAKGVKSFKKGLAEDDEDERLQKPPVMEQFEVTTIERDHSKIR
jgi:sec-independent protein translocase protein TatA